MQNTHTLPYNPHVEACEPLAGRMIGYISIALCLGIAYVMSVAHLFSYWDNQKRLERCEAYKNYCSVAQDAENFCREMPKFDHCNN